jgi:hypothetical protein
VRHVNIRVLRFVCGIKLIFCHPFLHASSASFFCLQPAFPASSSSAPFTRASKHIFLSLVLNTYSVAPPRNRLLCRFHLPLPPVLPSCSPPPLPTRYTRSSQIQSAFVVSPASPSPPHAHIFAPPLVACAATACLTLSMQFIFLPPTSSIPCLLVEPPPPSACCSAHHHLAHTAVAAPCGGAGRRPGRQSASHAYEASGVRFIVNGGSTRCGGGRQQQRQLPNFSGITVYKSQRVSKSFRPQLGSCLARYRLAIFTVEIKSK